MPNGLIHTFGRSTWQLSESLPCDSGWKLAKTKAPQYLPYTPNNAHPLCIVSNVKSAGYSEFYKAAQAGFQVELKVDVYTEEYEGQQAAELNGKRYRVLKTYVNKSGEITELTLSDLPVEESEEPDSGAEGGGGNGAV